MVTLCPLTEAKVRAHYQTRRVEERENPGWRGA